MKKHNPVLWRLAIMLYALLVSTLLSIGSAMAVEYTIIDLGTLGGSNSWAFAINDSGQVAGASSVAGDKECHAFLYNDRIMKDLGATGSISSVAYGINNDGMIVGIAFSPEKNFYYTFFYSGGETTVIEAMNGNWDYQDGINNSGQIVGTSTASSGTSKHAFLFSNGVMTDLGTLGGEWSFGQGINDAGQVVGYSTLRRDTSLHAFLYSGSGKGMIDLGTLGGTESRAYNINNSSQVVGQSNISTEDVIFHAFLYSKGKITDLGTLGGRYSIAYDINDLGWIVGSSETSWNTPTHAFLYTNNEMVDLNNLIPQNSGWELHEAMSINNKGQIAGGGIINGQFHAFLMTPICTYSINSIGAEFDSTAGADKVEVTTQAGCDWSVSSNQNWITIDSGASGNASGTVTYSIAANTGSASRSGVLMIAGNAFTVTQSAGSGKGPKGYTFCSRENQRCSFSGTMQVAFGANGAFVYKPFTNGVDCTTAIFGDPIAGAKACYTKGSNCSYTIFPLSKTFVSDGGIGSATVTASSSKCAWTSTSNTPWITITSGSSVTGSGTVGYSVSANTGTVARTGTATIAGQSFTANQEGLKQYTLSVTKSGAGSGTVSSPDGKINCGSVCSAAYNAKSTVTLSALADEGSFFSGWSGAACSGQGTCSDTIGTDLTVTASFAQCNITISTASKTFNENGGTGSVAVTAVAGNCAWTATSSESWISITSPKGTGNGTIEYSVAVNTGTSQRVGTITIAGQTHSVIQNGVPQYTLTVSKSGTGSGAVTSSDNRISCGASCSAVYTSGTSVSLSATPDSGLEFSGWSGGGCSDSGNCTVVMLSDTTISAAFDKPSPIRLTITYPSQGATIPAPHTLVRGTVTNSSGRETGVTVNGMPAIIYDDQFIANHIALAEGTNTITVSGTDTEGATRSASVSVNALVTGTYLILTARPEAGINPLETTLRINAPFSVTDPGIIFSGPGVVELMPSDYPDEYVYRMTGEGIYSFTAQAGDPQGGTYQDTVAVVVMNKDQMVSLLKTKWEGLKAALKAQNIDDAVQFFVAQAQEEYREAFEALKEQLPEIMDTFVEFNILELYANVAVYEVVADENGSLYSYPGRFVRDEKGVWKFNDF